MTLAPLPRGAAAVPDGCRVRRFAAGERTVWADIQASTGVYRSASPALFDREFGDDVAAHAARIIFIEAENEVVGVSAAWFPGPDVSATTGRVHWVATRLRPGARRR